MRMLFNELELLLLLLLVVVFIAVVDEVNGRDEEAVFDGDNGVEVFSENEFIELLAPFNVASSEDVDDVGIEAAKLFIELILRRRVLTVCSILARALPWAKFHFCSEVVRSLRR